MGFASAAIDATKVSIAKVQKERAETLKYSKVGIFYLFYCWMQLNSILFLLKTT